VEANGDTNYGKPWRDLLRDEPFTLLDIYHIILMAACRDPTCPGKNLPYAQYLDSTYGRNCFVCFVEDNETSEDFDI